MKTAAFAAATFLGAFLLFQVQPLIGKFILPWFGGATFGWAGITRGSFTTPTWTRQGTP